MRQNWLECTSATGGTGDLSLISTNGFPLLSAWVSGIRQVRYSILEFNSDPSSTNATLLLAEDGYCPLDASGPTLSRSDATAVIYSSWNGTNLFPKMGSATAASKQTFSASSSNIRVICSAASEDNPFLTPIVTATAAIGQGLGVTPVYLPPTLNPVSGTFNTYGAALGSGTLIYFPFLWANAGLYSQISINKTNGFSAATSSSILLGVYEVAKNGDPGRLLGNFGSAGSMVGAGHITSAALSPPVFLTPGWYYLGFLPQFVGASGNCLLSGASQWQSPGPLGMQFSQILGSQVTAQTVLTDPAVAPTALASGGNSGVVPVFGLK